MGTQELLLPELQDPFDKVQLDNVEDPPVWNGEALPSWSYKPEAVRLVNSLTWTVPPDSMDKACERAWVYILRVNILIWSFWAFCPFAGLFLSQCKEEGLATNPGVLIALYIPVLALALYWEVQAHSFIMPVEVKYLDKWQLLGKARSLKVFYAFSLGVSFLGHLDLATTGVFMARLVKTSQCSSDLERIWSSVVAQSFMRMLPSITTLVVVGYLLMLPQLILALLGGIPKCNEIQSHSLLHTEVGDDWYDLDWETHRSKWDAMHTLLGGDGCAGHELVSALASSARAGLLTSRNTKFVVGASSGYSVRVYREYRSSIVNKMRVVALRGLLNFLLEGAVQANIQVTTLALARALSQGAPADGFTALSSVLSLAMLVYNVGVTGTTLAQLTDRVWGKIQLSRALMPNEVDNGAELDSDEEMEQRRGRIVALWIIYGVSSMLSLGLAAYAGVKLLAAVFVCPMGVWNLSGCVQM